MGYDGGFTKIRMKLDNQKQLDDYYTKIRHRIYKLIGYDNFYKFESSAIDINIDNDWLEVEMLSRTGCKLRNYETDKSHYSYISKDILKKFIDNLKAVDLKAFYIFDSEEMFEEFLEGFDNDIKLLEELYEKFDWENDTLVFSYSY